MIPKVKNLPYLTRAQMIEVDHLMQNKFGINLIQMMEHAGRHLAYLTRVLLLNDDPRSKSVVVLVGHGRNGGGALVAARRLHNWGAFVQVILMKTRKDFKGIPKHQLEILENLNIPIDTEVNSDIKSLKIDVIIDGILGYNIKDHPKRNAKRLIQFANCSKAKVISLDIPSGMDPDQGIIYTPYVKPDITLTLALPKKAFERSEVIREIGDLYLADICVPDELYEKVLGRKKVSSIFAPGEILKLI